MPTKKPVIQIVLTEKYRKKLAYIAKEEERSKSNPVSYTHLTLPTIA